MRRGLAIVAVGVGLAALVVGVVLVKRHEPVEHDSRHPGTARMVERLAAVSLEPERVAEDPSEADRWAVNDPGSIPVLRERLESVRDPLERVVLSYRLAAEELMAGETEQALARLEGVADAFQEAPIPPTPEQVADLERSIGIAALRLGEQQNCIARHGKHSCLLPITADGVHTIERGSRRAIEAFSNELSMRSDALAARWLLNLAYMTLGEYPGAVPEQWLIPPEVFESDHDIGRFRDVALSAGLTDVGLAGGSVLEDIDGDGFLDIVTSSWGVRDQMLYYQNNGDGTFTDRTADAGLIGLVGGLNINHADYDNDGDPDVMVFRGGWLGELGAIPNSLLRNNGDGTFDDVTEEAGLLELHPTHSGAWGDFNNDGWLDLFVGSEQRSKTHPHPSHLYVNNGDGTFDEIADAVGLADQGFVKGVVWGDYDNDGRLDLYVSTFGSANRLYRNEGPGGTADARDWRFRDVTADAGVGEPVFSFPTWFFDYDNDGWEDIFVSSWDPVGIGVVAARYLGLPHATEGPRLYRNNGDGTFDDVTQDTRLDDGVLLAMAANFGDLDNDGWLDFYIGTGAPGLETLMPNKMFRNAEGKWFQDVTSSGGFGHLQKGHGIAFGDVDNDGDQDVFAVMGGWFSGDVYQNVLFENPGHGGHTLALRLEGTRSNRAAVGARVRVRVTTPQGARDIRTTVGTGGSFGSSTLRQEIGLADAIAIDFVEVTWPASGEVQVIRDLALDGFYRIREGDPGAVSVPRSVYAFEGSEPSGDGHR